MLSYSNYSKSLENDKSKINIDSIAFHISKNSYISSVNSISAKSEEDDYDANNNKTPFVNYKNYRFEKSTKKTEFYD